MRVGVRLGIDAGKARIGVARSDPHGMLATPIETVRRDSGGEADVARIAELVAEYEAFELIVGLPLNMRGERTPSTEDAANFADQLARKLAGQVQVRLVDERLSTVSAQGQLHQVGKRTKESRSVIDQAAAVVILQHALDIERNRDEPPGTLVEATFDDESNGDSK
ncbi:Holliday junction resolvase RuvX [Leucobacter denitrificans]|uniref:Putative pre-16S rRNA nuclease n=1 Tax=Leucobacter denitrificans TaxID=683042 RepID=A0A7G9S5I2_9MICO|nr:Holliday junction resolvase RuvX [Leucobacter denitrificans]QNN63107.1 Holliday junction resolvase RuvX [Leucobacter denitrificans]